MRQLLDPRLHQSLGEFWPDLATIQIIVTVADAANQPVVQSPITGSVLGMDAIPCRIGPMIQVRPTDEEVRDGKITDLILHRELKLSGYFPTITAHIMQAVVKGITYKIVGVESDSQSFSTRLRLEIIKP